jgi:hypothetical protein
MSFEKDYAEAFTCAEEPILRLNRPEVKIFDALAKTSYTCPHEYFSHRFATPQRLPLTGMPCA